MRAADHLPERYNAADGLVARHVREGRGDTIAILTDTGSTSYAELDARVRRFASVVRGLGVHRGERVAFVLLDGLSLATGFLGAIAAGAVAVPINTLLKPQDHRAIVLDCEPRLVVVDPRVIRSESLGDLGDDVTVWTVDELEAALARAEPVAAYADTHRDAFAFFLYSSGTTGRPKGVVHLQHDMWVCCETYGKTVLETAPSDRAFSVAKLFFAYGLGNALYFPLHVGATTVLAESRPSPEVVFAQVAAHRPTLFFGVPTAYANMLAAMDAGAAYDFSSVRRCVSAGEALPGPVLARWKERTGLDILDGIGSTEICHVFLSNRHGDVRPGSSGKPVEGYVLRLVDENGHEVPRGELGDLVVDGDSTAALYWNQHEVTKRTIVGSSIRTGDKYRQDEDGYFFHAGRSDDMIKAGGIWVSPVEVEATLMAHPAVLECAVVGIADHDGLEKPHAYVTLRDRDAGSVEDLLRAFVKERLAPYKCPRTITVVGELPKTATGKVQRFALRAR